MEQTQLALEELYRFDTKNLANLVSSSNKPIILIVKHESIGFAGEHLSIAIGFLKILYIAETISVLCEEIEFEEHHKSYYYYIHFRLRPKNSKNLAEKLIWLSNGLYNSEEIDFLDNEVEQEIVEFQDRLDNVNVRFCKILDDYWLNYIAGVDEEWGHEDTNEWYPSYPERNFGFIRPCESIDKEIEFYSSPWSWIVPYHTDIATVLAMFSGYDEPPVTHRAVRLQSDSIPPIVFNQNVIINYPLESVAEAQECAAKLSWKWSNSQQTIHDFNYFDVDIELSSEGEILVISDKIARYVFFDHTVVPPETLQQYAESLSFAINALHFTITGPADISCPWNMIDDELFEQLCYDVLYYSGKFDVQRMTKMGVSKSRDGGRDIEAYTVKRIGQTSEKWIIQCKFSKTGASLSGSKLTGISDTIDQYGADGLCVMTNGLIDSTLHDRITAITEKRNIKSQLWSRLELERFIARHSSLRDRYFPTD